MGVYALFNRYINQVSWDELSNLIRTGNLEGITAAHTSNRLNLATLYDNKHTALMLSVEYQKKAIFDYLLENSNEQDLLTTKSLDNNLMTVLHIAKLASDPYYAQQIKIKCPQLANIQDRWGRLPSNDHYRPTDTSDLKAKLF